MRVSERVRPTADLTPAPHKMCNKLLKFARLFKFSTCRNISKACTQKVLNQSLLLRQLLMLLRALRLLKLIHVGQNRKLKQE